MSSVACAWMASIAGSVRVVERRVAAAMWCESELPAGCRRRRRPRDTRITFGHKSGRTASVPQKLQGL